MPGRSGAWAGITSYRPAGPLHPVPAAVLGHVQRGVRLPRQIAEVAAVSGQAATPNEA